MARAEQDPWVEGYRQQINQRVDSHLEAFYQDIDKLFARTDTLMTQAIDRAITGTIDSAIDLPERPPYIPKSERDPEDEGLPRELRYAFQDIAKLLDPLPTDMGCPPEIMNRTALAIQLKEIYEGRGAFWAKAAGKEPVSFFEDAQPFPVADKFEALQSDTLANKENGTFTSTELLAWLAEERAPSTEIPLSFSSWRVGESEVSSLAVWQAAGELTFNRMQPTDTIHHICMMLIVASSLFYKGEGQQGAMSYVLGAEQYIQQLNDPEEKALANSLVAKAFSEAWTYTIAQNMQLLETV